MPDGGTASRVDSLLLELASQEATGCLTLTEPDGELSSVWFRDGLVYSVSVPGRRPLLGVRLMSSGALTPEALAEALEVQRTELQGWRLGELLVHLGFVDRTVVEEFVSEQLRDQVADLRHWTVADKKFRNGKRTRQDIAPPLEVTDLLALARQRDDRWAEIVPFIGGSDSVPVLSTAATAASDVVLGPYDWALLCKVDAVRTIADLADDCGFTVFEAGMVVMGLLDAGLVEIAGAEVEEDLAEPWDDEDPSDAAVAESVARVAAALTDMGMPSAGRSPFDNVEDEPRSDDDAGPAADQPGPSAAAAEPERAPTRTSPFAPARITSRATREPVREEAGTEDEELADVVNIADQRETRVEAERIAAQEEAARIAAEEEDARVEAERIAAEEEAARVAAEEEAARIEAERIAAEEEAARVAAEEEAARIEAERIAAEEEAARVAAEEEAARIAAEEEAARIEAERIAAEEEAARVAAEEEAARIEAERIAAEEEAARIAAEEEAARVAAEEEAARIAAEAEAARVEAERVAAEEEAARIAAEEEAARIEAERIAAEVEAARIAAEEEAARIAAEVEAARIAAEEEAARIEAERIAAEEAARVEAERAAAEAAVRAELERIAVEEAERHERDRAAQAELEREQAALLAIGLAEPVPTIEGYGRLEHEAATDEDDYVDEREPVTVDLGADEHLSFAEAAASAASVFSEVAHEATPAPEPATHHGHSFDLDSVDPAPMEAPAHEHLAPGPAPAPAPAYELAPAAAADPVYAPEPVYTPAPEPAHQYVAEHRSEYYGSGPRVVEPELEPAYVGGSGRVEGADMAALLRELSSLGGAPDNDSNGTASQVVSRPVHAAVDPKAKKKRGFFSR